MNFDFFRSNRKVKVWALVLILFVVLVVALCLRDARADHRREMHAYSLLDSCMDPLMFEDFIAKFPDSKHIEDVRERYLSLVSEQRELREQVMRSSLEELKTFVTENPERRYLVNLANARIDSMDWQTASSNATLKSLGKYITDHPDGIFMTQAQTQYQKLDRLRIEAELEAQRDTTEAAADSIATEEGQ